jgi:hypothetical protein
MSADLNPYSSPRVTSEEQRDEHLIVALAKCVIVGTSVGFLGAGLCVLSLPILLSIREMGILLLLFLIPLGVWCMGVITRKYLSQGTSRLRGAVAWGARYLLVGAGLGLVLKLFVICGEISDTPFIVFLGSVIGTMSGSLGGAFHGWLGSRRRPVTTPNVG